MPATRNILAIDLGAESGRGVIGAFDGSTIRLDVIHRFPNGPVATLDTLHWDVLRLHAEIMNALRLAAGHPGGIASVGVDTWGVDFALLGRGGTLLGNPRHYRDPHTEGVMERAFRVVPREQIYRRTGLQFMRFNTLFQLIALKEARSPLLDVAEQLLFMPDLFHYLLTGIKANEFTDASTSQMLDPLKRNWAYDLVGSFGLPTKMLGTIVPPGTVLGPLRTSVATDTGLVPVPVIAPGTHDTASAIAAVPATGDSWAYISSGTWSLMGVELPEEIMDFLAHRIRANIRRLEGALIRVASYAALTGKKLTVEVVEGLLRELLHEEGRGNVSIDLIQKKVAEHFDLRVSDMSSKRRPENIAFPRQIAMYLSRHLTESSLSAIGEAFGGRDHGTVMHACKLVKDRMEVDANVRQVVSYLEKQLAR
jgi:sugar (pentulose or hexulose) kinase